MENSKKFKEEKLKWIRDKSWYWYNEMMRIKNGGYCNMNRKWYLERCEKNSRDFSWLYREYKKINNL